MTRSPHSEKSLAVEIDPQRGAVLFEGADLHRGGVCPQGHGRTVGFDEKGVLHVPCWMLLREVQGREVVPIVFHFGSLRTNETNALKNGCDPFHHLADWVPCGRVERADRTCRVHIKSVGFA